MGEKKQSGETHRGNATHRVLVALCSVVFAVSVMGLAFIGCSYLQAGSKYDDLARNVTDLNSSDAHLSLQDMTADWEHLRDENPDVVGWVYMPGTNVNYPIVQGDDNEEYLHKNFSGDEDGVVHTGCIFLNCENAADYSDMVSTIFGHNMQDGSMFGQLAQMADEGDFQDHDTLYVLTPSANYQVKLFAVSKISSQDTGVMRRGYSSPAALQDYATDLSATAQVKLNDVPVSPEQLIQLVTCVDAAAETRYLIVGYVEDTAEL